MKGCALTQQGIEDLSAMEVRELLDTKIEEREGIVLFDIKKKEDLCVLCYAAQSLTKVLFFLGECSYENAASILELKETGDFVKDKTFSVRCVRVDNEKESPDIEAELGSIIAEKWGSKVELGTPDVQITAIIIKDKCYLGVDFSREDLGKREYRIFTGSDVLKATTAYAAVRFSEFKRGEILIDPFCRSGTIAIEAALYDSQIPVNKHRKKDFFFSKLGLGLDYKPDERPPKECKVNAIDADMKKVTSAKKNAKIADVNKHISFSRQDLKFLELKFEEGTVNRIVTMLPYPSKRADEKKIKSTIEEFFYQSTYILEKKGKVVSVARAKEFYEPYATKHGFVLEEEREVLQGKEKLLFLKWKKNGQA